MSMRSAASWCHPLQERVVPVGAVIGAWAREVMPGICGGGGKDGRTEGREDGKTGGQEDGRTGGRRDRTEGREDHAGRRRSTNRVHAGGLGLPLSTFVFPPSRFSTFRLSVLPCSRLPHRSSLSPPAYIR